MLLRVAATSQPGGAGTARSHGKKQFLSQTARTPNWGPTVTNKQDNGLEARRTQPLSQDPAPRAAPVPSGGPGTGPQEPGEGRGQDPDPRQSHSLCDTAGARGWLGSRMTHPQWSPETPVGSFAQQVFSLIWRGVNSSPVEQLEGLSLLHPSLGLAGDPRTGLWDPSPSGRGCFGLPWSHGRGQPRGSDSAVISAQLSPSNRHRDISAAPTALGTDGGARQSAQCRGQTLSMQSTRT